jgi:hypothetical protein
MSAAPDRDGFLLRTAHVWFEAWVTEDCYQVTDIIYGRLFDVLKGLGRPAVLEFVRATLTQGRGPSKWTQMSPSTRSEKSSQRQRG